MASGEVAPISTSKGTGRGVVTVGKEGVEFKGFKLGFEPILTSKCKVLRLALERGCKGGVHRAAFVSQNSAVW